MSKNKLCLILVIITLVVGVVLLTSVAYAMPVDKYIEADIELSAISVFGEDTKAVVSFWESDDNKSWSISSDFDSSWCDVLYYNAEDNSVLGLTPPTAVGKYIVRVIVNQNYNQTNYFYHGKKLDKDTVLSSFAYQIVYENLVVVFAPNKNVVFEEGKDYFEQATFGTKVYYKGKELNKDSDYVISLSVYNDGEYAPCIQAVNPGTYKISVKLNSFYPNANISNEQNTTFESTFEIINSVANIVKLNSTKIYEGMYQTDSEKRNDYYSVKYNGLISTDSNFNGKYTISYLKGNKVLDANPTEKGNYTVRFTFNETIPVYDISKGDFVDLPYTIHQKPYTVKFENNATSVDGYSLVYQGQPIVITPVFNESIKTLSEVKYYVYESDNTGKKFYKQLSYGVYPLNVGTYKAEFKIDISKGDISGSSIFGSANEDYVIDENNNTLFYEFQIIPSLTVNFNSDYVTAQTEYSSVVDYNGKRPNVIESIQDSTLADISKDLYSINYYDADWNLTDANAPGEYYGVVTFNIADSTNIDAEGRKYWSNADTVIVDGTEYYFKFKVESVKSNISAVKVNNGIVLNFGSKEIDPNSYKVQYFKFDNNINYNTTNSELVNQVGVYHIVVSFNSDNFDLGFAKGEICIIEYVNSSEGSLSNIKISLDNAIESGNGYSIKYDGNVKPVNVLFENDDDTIIETLNYSLYYQKLSRNGDAENDDDWSISDIPIMPGVYRAVFVVNEPNIYFNANTGDILTYEYTINSLQLVPSFEVKINDYTKDLVFDNNPKGKDFNVSFTVNGRPVDIDRSLYTLRYATKGEEGYSVFKAENPVNAGDYVIAVYFNYSENHILDKYGIYCDEPTITDPENFTAENMAVRSVFSKTVTVEKLSLTLVAKIPVEEIAMYDLDGGEVKPSYEFFKTNGYPEFYDYADFSALLNENSDQPLSYIGISDFDGELFTGNINSITCDKKVDKSLATGRYINNFTLKEESRENIVINKVLYTYDGAKPNVSYNTDFYYASRKSDSSFTVEYRVTPLPLIINTTALESIQENTFEEHYFGNTRPVVAENLTFSTLNRNGEKYNLIDNHSSIVDNLISYITLSYYRRLTGEAITENNPIVAVNDFGMETTDLGTIDGYLFDSGDYTLRISFNDNSNEEYTYFTLVNGYNEHGAYLNGNEMEGNSYSDIRFRVLNANPLRVVFDRANFNSFVADGNEKAFNIKFMCGNIEVEGISYTLLKFRCVNGVEEQITGSEYPRLAGDYAIQISFDADNYKYKIEQNDNAGECSSNAPYIVNQSFVKFYYKITNPIYLSWEFLQNGNKLNNLSGNYYSFSGDPKDLTVRFFDSNNTSTQVNLIQNIDYAIWYYKTSGTGANTYTKLLQAPYETGSYVMELVFLRTLHDYKVSDDAGIPYSYQEAELEEGRFGRSLVYSSNNNLYLTMYNEKRYVEFNIVSSDVLIGGWHIKDKTFDNDNIAELSGKLAINSVNGNIVDSYLSQIKEFMSKPLRAYYQNVGVGINFVDLYMVIYSDGEKEVLLKLPQQRDLENISSVEFLKSSLKEVVESSDFEIQGVKDAVSEIEKQIEKIFSCYNLYFADLSGYISKSYVLITPNPFARDYDPFYRDTDQLTFSYDNALISSFMIDNIFTGSLTRDGRETENKVGNYIILLGTLSLANEYITLSDGTEAKLNECFVLKLASGAVYYTINKKAITVAITEGLTKYYDEDDPEFKCEITAGQLISGDKLLFDGENKPQRKTLKERDDIGTYEIDMSPIKIIDSQGADTSGNYRISFVKSVFTILAKEIVVIPIETPNAVYTDNFYALYNINATQKRYSIKYNLNGILKDYTLTDGYSLSGSFGLEQIANTDSQVSAKYKITLGSIGVVDKNGKNVSKNYVITTRGTVYYTVRKIPIVLELAVKDISKTYSSPDPIIPLKELSTSALPEGYSLRADSSATRKPGEEVGEYEILLNNTDKIYIIEDATNNVVTKYFNIIIRNGVTESNPKGTTFKIVPYQLYVSVRESTFVKGYSAIIAEMLFKDKDGKTVSQSVLEKLSVSFKPLIIENPVEGLNQVEIELSDNSVEDPNFEIIRESGFVTVIFPENNVSVKVIDNSEEVVQKNAYVFTDGMLLETKQMYLASTDNGKNPTKYITITLPVREDLINKELYVVAVRSDGSYEILDAEVGEGIIKISDNEFNYIMLCSLRTWPYYVAGAFVILVIIGLLAFVISKLIRRKRRNGEKAVNFRKVKKDVKKGNVHAESKYRPNESENHAGSFDDIDVGVVTPTTPKVENNDSSEQKKKNKNKPEKKSDENAKTKPLSGAKPSDKGGKVSPEKPKVELGSSVKPSIHSSSADDDIIVPVSSDDKDTIIVPTSKKGVDESTVSPSNISPIGSNTDDEIVISKTRKIGLDDDDI